MSKTAICAVMLLAAVAAYSDECPCYLSLQYGSHSGAGKLSWAPSDSLKTRSFSSGRSAGVNGGYYFTEHLAMQFSWQNESTHFGLVRSNTNIGGWYQVTYAIPKRFDILTFGPEFSSGFRKRSQFFAKVHCGLTVSEGEPLHQTSWDLDEYTYKKRSTVIGASLGYRYFIEPYAALTVEGYYFDIQGWQAHSFSSVLVGITFRF